MEKIKLILDTDIGSDIDDALCLGYLLKQPRCEILGITTGSSEPQKRAELADTLCQAAGRDIPIYPGLGQPIIGRQLQGFVHQYAVTEQLPHRTEFPKNGAIEFMKKTVEENPHEITIAAVGPLTNVGALFAAYPHVVPLVKQVAVMAGSFFAEAVAYIATEWNVVCDPIAAKVVFDSGVPLIVAGLDVTLKTLTSCTEFLKKPHTGVMKAVAVHAEKFLERTDNMHYHDPLAAALLFDRDICEYKRGTVHVDYSGEKGRSYFIEKEDGNALVAYAIDRERFFEHYNGVVGKEFA